jgi:broad specificity phosphatase PhoE
MVLVLFIRHAQSTFNSLYCETEDHCPSTDPWIIDAPLSELGISQVAKLAKTIHEHVPCNQTLIVSSPLTRALQTTKALFFNSDKISKDSITAVVHPLCTEFIGNMNLL